MRTKFFLILLLVILSGLLGKATAVPLIEIDISDPSAVTFTATSAFSTINETHSDTEDGISFLDFFSSDVQRSELGSLSGNLSVPGVTSSYAYDKASTNPSDLDLRFYSEFAPKQKQNFSTNSEAFRGVGTLNMSAVVDRLKTVGSYGDIAAGDDFGDPVIGTWAIVNEPEPEAPQIFFLSFDSENLILPSIKEPTKSYPLFEKKSAGLTEVEELQVTQTVQKIFEDFNVSVTNIKPNNKTVFSTIHVGGTQKELPTDINSLWESTTNPEKPPIRGFSSNLDFQNQLNDDWGFAFSDTIRIGVEYQMFLSDLANTIAHEASHLMGLLHVYGTTELLYPRAADRTDNLISDELFSGAYYSSFQNKVVAFDDYEQNSFQELGRNVGLKNTSIELEGPFLEDISRLGWGAYFEIGLSQNVYDARLLISLSEDILPMTIELGDLFIGDILKEVELLYSDSFRYAILGASSSGGETDIYGTMFSIAGILPSELLLGDLFSLGSPTSLFNLYIDNGTRLDPIGTVNVELIASVDEQKTLILLSLGVMFLSLIRRRQWTTH